MCSRGLLIFNAACLPDKVIYGRNAKCGVDTRVSRHPLKHSARTYCTSALTSKHPLKLFLKKAKDFSLKNDSKYHVHIKETRCKRKGDSKKCFVFFQVAVVKLIYFMKHLQNNDSPWLPLPYFTLQVVFQLYFSGQCHTDEDLLTAELLMKTAVCTGCKAAHFSLTVYECNHNSSVQRLQVYFLIIFEDRLEQYLIVTLTQ